MRFFRTHYYEKYMICVGIGGQLLFYVQAFRIFHDRCAAEVSLTGFLIGLFSVTNWLIYGLVIQNRVLILSNLFAVVGALLVVSGILIYS